MNDADGSSLWKENMSWRVNKKLLQTFSILIFLAYLSLLVYQTVYSGEGTNNEDSDTLKKYNCETNLTQDFDNYENIQFPTKNSTELPSTTVLDDVFISVKTTRKNHYSRLLVILKTWFRLAKNHIWFFTDIDDPDFQLKTNGHMIKTNCPSSHSMEALCCKMSVEFDTYLSTNRKYQFYGFLKIPIKDVESGSSIRSFEVWSLRNG